MDKVETKDRILEQIYKYKAPVKSTKTIFVNHGPLNAQKRLESENCPVTDCKFLNNADGTKAATKADAVILFEDHTRDINVLKALRPKNQIWIWQMLESPPNVDPFDTYLKQQNLINWTATYRRDSVLVTPYSKFVFYSNYTGLPKKPKKNYAAGKTRKVAWFVSNCNPPNGRSNYVRELIKYIEVDVYGACSDKVCPKINEAGCDDLLNKDYKFYLSFENSNCKDYITEKFFQKGLG